MIVVTLEGPVRNIRALRRKSDNSIFAMEYSVLSQVEPNCLGDTVRVTQFSPSGKGPFTEKDVEAARQADTYVEWAVSAKATEFGLNLVFLEDLVANPGSRQKSRADADYVPPKGLDMTSV